jgi:hypothetical protein
VADSRSNHDGCADSRNGSAVAKVTGSSGKWPGYGGG